MVGGLLIQQGQCPSKKRHRGCGYRQKATQDTARRWPLDSNCNISLPLRLQPASLPCRSGLASPPPSTNGFLKINLSLEIHTFQGFCFSREWSLTQPESEFSGVYESYSLCQ